LTCTRGILDFTPFYLASDPGEGQIILGTAYKPVNARFNGRPGQIHSG